MPFFSDGLLDPFALNTELAPRWRRNRFEGAFDATPRFDVQEEDDAIRLRMEVPGLRPEDLTVDVRDGVLTVEGVRNTDAPEGYRSWRRERGGYRLARRVRLADGLDVDAAEAKLEHGILTIRLPKRPEVQPRRIPVKVS
jgi:HSP20 family protein